VASIQLRIFLGFIAGAISVLTFHQGMWELLHVLAIPGFTMPPPFPLDPVPPLNVPRIASLSFWGGLWGVLFMLVWRGQRGMLWLGGLGLGVAAASVGLLVVAPLKGQPFAAGFQLNSWIRSLLINGTWGLGVGLLLLVLLGMAARQGAFANR
jgi:hypothetical protein